MPNLNQCNFIGHLTRDPELKHSKDGQTVFAKGGIAVNSGWGDREKTTFLSFTCFGKAAEAVCKFVKKGDPIYLSGELECDIVKKDDGTETRYWGLRVERMQFLGGKRAAKAAERSDAAEPEPAHPRPAAARATDPAPQDFTEIPF